MTMYTARKTEIGKLRKFEQELSAQYGEAVLRKHWDEAQSLWNRRHGVRRAILQHQEWHVDAPVVEDGHLIELPILSEREEAVEEELARAA
jgi:hypothetical protein